jgi:hypothetical protein
MELLSIDLGRRLGMYTMLRETGSTMPGKLDAPRRDRRAVRP